MTKRAQPSPEQQTMKSIAVGALRDRLNTFYSQSTVKNRSYRPPEHFDYLWDLKELALLDRKSSVEVPEEWLLELDEFESDLKNKNH